MQTTSFGANHNMVMENPSPTGQIRVSNVPRQTQAPNGIYEIKTERIASSNLGKRTPEAVEGGCPLNAETPLITRAMSPKKRRKLVQGKNLSENDVNIAEVSDQPSDRVDVASTLDQQQSTCQVDLRPLLDHNDLEKSVADLQPGVPLSATTIITIIGILAPHQEDVCVLDPAKYMIDSHAPVIQLPKSKEKSQQILIPLHHAKLKHWSLAHIDIPRNCISHYDSLPQSEAVDHRSEVIECKMRKACQVFRGGEREWSFFHEGTPKQPNTYDCGIYVILIACHLLHQLPIPGRIEGEIWRLVFIKILSAGCLEDGDQKISRVHEAYSHSKTPWGHSSGVCK